MPKIKGIGLVNIRTLFRKRPPAEEKLLLSRLTPEEQTIYLTTITTSWTPLEIQNNIYLHAGEILFPQDKEKFVSLGKAVAALSYTGVYKAFLRVLSPEAVVRRFVNIWALHHDTGKPAYEMKEDKHIRLIVREFPSLPAATRQLITGHMIKIIELIGIKVFTVHLIEGDPENWRWDILWVK